eukprot:2369338-Prorocentrum_lima.AAC.1
MLEAIPKHIQVQCKNYGTFSIVRIIVRVMREVLQTKEFSRLSMASYVQARPTKVPSTKTGLAQWLEEYYSKLEMALTLGCALEPRIIMRVLTYATEK